MTEQELIDEAKARANLATQKLNELLHNDSVNCTVNHDALPAAFIESVRTGVSFIQISSADVIKDRI